MLELASYYFVYLASSLFLCRNASASPRRCSPFNLSCVMQDHPPQCSPLVSALGPSNVKINTFVSALGPFLPCHDCSRWQLLVLRKALKAYSTHFGIQKLWRISGPYVGSQTCTNTRRAIFCFGRRANLGKLFSTENERYKKGNPEMEPNFRNSAPNVKQCWGAFWGPKVVQTSA